ncbi:MAG: double zinc ribbon domain-containing protein [Nitrospiria bacterium]
MILHCPECDTPNLNQSSYCEKCLTEFPSYLWEKHLFCPECHYENPAKYEFCDRCHEPLRPGQSE